MTGTLKALTVPLGESRSPEGLSAFLVRDNMLSWNRRESGLVGFGELDRFTATGPDRFINAEQWWKHLILDGDIRDEVNRPGTGAVAFGSFAFSKTSNHLSRLIVPELVVGLRDGAAWATLQTYNDAEITSADVLAALDGWLGVEPSAAGSTGSSAGSSAGVGSGLEGTLATGALSESEWTEAVRLGVEQIGTGRLEKLVLARDVVATIPDGVHAAAVLKELAQRYRDCWTYGVDGLVGSTPEMLIQVEGRTAQARVLAGTLDRRDAVAHDPNGDGLAYAERMLAGSAKQLHEHKIAIASLTTALEPFSEAMSAHTEPFILELPNVWHLASDVRAELADAEGHVPTSLALINALHPTAAVCGTPTAVAGELLRELEKMERGPYAGPVGWLDSAGNGEWGIALRGAVIESPTQVRLYAGCGIVAGSDPAAELAETWAKFRPMLEALGLRT
ncbi:isochorismate synthase [Pseudarthrobacter sp. J1763]|uniref:isochorismate synthase n=1 Tax=Pseudarthrobacter sp. J1763 TaxID=3420445 RepID=UPI003D28FB14